MNCLIARSEKFATSSNLRVLFYPVWPGDFSLTSQKSVIEELYRLNVKTLEAADQNSTDPNFPALARL